MGDMAWLDPTISSFLCVGIWGEGQAIPRTIIMLALLSPSIYSCGMGLGSLADWAFRCPPSLLLHGLGCGTWVGPYNNEMTLISMSYIQCPNFHP